MLPIQIERRFKNPGELEEEFLNYLKDSNAPINQSKTIASNVLYHAKNLSGVNSSVFFTGSFTPSDTNIVGTFVRPESEHFVIYAIRCYTSNVGSLGAIQQIWERGLLSAIDSIPYNANISITVNSIRLLKRVPLTEFDSDLTTKDQGTIYLDEPILWQGQTELQLTLDTPQGAVFAQNQWLRFDLVGIGLI